METGLQAIYDDLKAMIRREVEAELGWREIATESKDELYYSLLWNEIENVYKVTIRRTSKPFSLDKPYDIEVWYGGGHRGAILKADELLESWANPKVEVETTA